eukprot:m51a1_g9177 hypothetical protein (273) ;mRNA; f:49470-50288
MAATSTEEDSAIVGSPAPSTGVHCEVHTVVIRRLVCALREQQEATAALRTAYESEIAALSSGLRKATEECAALRIIANDALVSLAEARALERAAADESADKTRGLFLEVQRLAQENERLTAEAVASTPVYDTDDEDCGVVDKVDRPQAQAQGGAGVKASAAASVDEELKRARAWIRGLEVALASSTAATAELKCRTVAQQQELQAQAESLKLYELRVTNLEAKMQENLRKEAQRRLKAERASSRMAQQVHDLQAKLLTIPVPDPDVIPLGQV